MSVSDVARTSVTRALAVPGGSGPAAIRLASPPLRQLRPGEPIARRPSTRPAADRNVTRTAARLRVVPPSHADSRYRVPAGSAWPAAGRSGTCCRSRAVPPAPPANRCPPRTAGQRPAARGNRGVPYRTTVGKPLATRQPGIVTASQPWADTSPACAPGLSSRLVPGPLAARAARRPARPEPDARWLARPAPEAAGPARPARETACPAVARAIGAEPTTSAPAQHISAAGTAT